MNFFTDLSSIENNMMPVPVKCHHIPVPKMLDKS